MLSRRKHTPSFRPRPRLRPQTQPTRAEVSECRLSGQESLCFREQAAAMLRALGDPVHSFSQEQAAARRALQEACCPQACSSSSSSCSSSSCSSSSCSSSSSSCSSSCSSSSSNSLKTWRQRRVQPLNSTTHLVRVLRVQKMWNWRIPADFHMKPRVRFLRYRFQCADETSKPAH
ncbi:hypothetical protein CRUP_021274 [Coryphaenoides rupestris]|nr:hypothetical protein CRUP_021274 [Coryphaenoides rupestris]